MNSVIEQLSESLKAMPRSKKLVMGAVILLAVAGFASMFLWANKIDYQTLYANLSPEDAAEIVARLKEQHIPYQLTGNGNSIMVPAEKVYDMRLSMAAAGLPKGGAVGFELFNETNFATTEFVQKLNYKRALQGELARTIREFREVTDARVMIVMPKESVFIEETKPPSASVLLKLNGSLNQEKISAVVHLVASAIEDLSPERVTVVDTSGKVLSTGAPEQETAGGLASKQLEYKIAYEQNLTRRIQTMLERIVGPGKAIVGVSADMDFNQVDINEEIYDPDAQVIRSRQNTVESSDKKTGPAAAVSSVNPSGAGVPGLARETADTSQSQNETVNYEINKTVRRTMKPVGALKRLSVAAVLDGTYVFETDDKGEQVRKFVPRTQGELDQFRKIIQNAMGYSADREDQVSVESFPVSSMEEMALDTPAGIDWFSIVKQYGRSFINIILIMVVFLFVVRPLIKTAGEIKTAVVEPALIGSGNKKGLQGPEQRDALPEPVEIAAKQKAEEMANQSVERTASMVKGWLSEAS